MLTVIVLNVIVLNTTMLNVVAFCTMTLGTNDTYHNANGRYAGCLVFYYYAECSFTECRYAECLYFECRGVSKSHWVHPKAQFYKTFLSVNLRFFVISLSVC